jgi:hypothetical protein
MISVINDGQPEMSGEFMRIKDATGSSVQLCPNTVQTLRAFFVNEKNNEFRPAEFVHVKDCGRVIGSIIRGYEVCKSGNYKR